MTLPETSLANENRQRIGAVNAITAHRSVEEGQPSRRIQRGRPLKDDSSQSSKPRSLIPQAKRYYRSKNEKRPTKCFFCLGNPSLTLRERIVSYATPGSLSKYFLKKRVKELEDRTRIDCRIFDVRMEHRIALLIHTERFHGVRQRD